MVTVKGEGCLSHLCSSIAASLASSIRPHSCHTETVQSYISPILGLISLGNLLRPHIIWATRFASQRCPNTLHPIPMLHSTTTAIPSAPLKPSCVRVSLRHTNTPPVLLTRSASATRYFPLIHPLPPSGASYTHSHTGQSDDDKMMVIMIVMGAAVDDEDENEHTAIPPAELSVRQPKPRPPSRPFSASPEVGDKIRQHMA